MDGINRGTPEMTVHSAAGSDGEAKQQASRTCTSPGTTSQATGGDTGGTAGHVTGAKGWKLDCF
jgi:hypothetical protein